MLVLVLVFVFLFLAAQYESWSVPIAALLSLPIAALGAFIGIAVAGLDNDIYFQIGLVTLIGLAAKNAILIIEFAKVQVDNGESPANAAIRAARLRFRPILMTSLAFILGMLPMVLATGPGSASRHAIGTGVFFGMIFATTFGIVMIPFFFVLVYEAKDKFRLLKLPKVNVPERYKLQAAEWKDKAWTEAEPRLRTLWNKVKTLIDRIEAKIRERLNKDKPHASH